MAVTSTLSGTSLGYNRRVVSHVRTYNWPPLQLNLWIFVMLLASSSIVGVFSVFAQMQVQLNLQIPWYFPYFITVGAITMLFIGGIVWLIYNRLLLPAIVMVGAFIVFVLWMVGLVAVSIQLWGPGGSVQDTCNLQVFNQSPQSSTESTLAWMQQKNICQSWQLVFAMALTGIIFLLWVMVMAYQVFITS